MRVVHPTADVDERQMFQDVSADFFSIEDLPPIPPCLIHLSGLADQEFTTAFMRGLKGLGHRLSVDLQDFVRQVDPETRVIRFRDVPGKRELVSMCDIVKLDVVEAKILTGTEDLEKAAEEIEKWGCPETLITRSDGVLVRRSGLVHFETYTNRNNDGRTGRGDTTIGAYLARRLDYGVEDALKFASALASIKMETAGPFRGTIEDVLDRMRS